MSGRNQSQIYFEAQPPEYEKVIRTKVLKYVARVSKSGVRLYVVIPKKLHSELKPGQDVIVYIQPI